MAVEITPRQAEVLRVIKNHIRKERISPTVRELSAKLDVTISTVHKLLRALKEKGLIDLRENISRGIILRDTPSTIGVPLLGRIPAGKPVLSEEINDGFIELDSSFVPKGELFALKVKGDSMIGANILDGDTAIIKIQEDAESGEIVAVQIEEEATLKRLKKKGKKIILIPENNEYRPIEVNLETTSIRILGKLVAILRRF